MEFRPATVDDSAGILAIYAPYCLTPISFELSPPPLEEMRRRVAQTLEKYPWLVAVDGGQIAGYAYAHNFRDRPAYRWAVETSVYIDQARLGQGIGKALYERLLPLVKAQGFVMAMAGVTQPNPASNRLHESLGFQQVGVFHNVGYKNDAWHDVAFFELVLNPAGACPAEPVWTGTASGVAT